MPIQFDFSGKGVFVTDSAAGLGARIAMAFHELGARVAIHGATARAVEDAITRQGGGPRLVAAPGDLTRIADVPRIMAPAIAALGRLDVLVCCAAKASLRAVGSIGEADFATAMGANTKAAFFTTQACVPALRATRGAVVHIASTVGLVGGPTGAVCFATASGATMQMARMMALELAPDGVRVNAVCPAWAESEDPAVAGVYDAYIRTRSPLARVASEDECVAAVLGAAAPFASYMTGATVVVDGGIASGHYVG